MGIIRRILERLIFAGLVLNLLFNSLAFGGVHDVSFAITATVVLLLACLCAIRVSLDPANGRDEEAVRSRLQKCLLPILPAILLAVLALSFCPLPQAVLRLLSPKTAELTQYALHNLSDGEACHWSTVGVVPLISIRRWIGFFVYVLFFLVASRLLLTERSARRFAWALVGMGTLLAAITFAQMLSGEKGGIYGFWRSRYSGGWYGTFVNRNTFAAHIGMLIPLAIGLAASLSARSRCGSASRQHSRRAFVKWLQALRPGQVLLAGIALLLTATVFCSLSRGAFLAFVGTFLFALLLVWVLFRSRGAVRLVLSAGTLLLLFGIWLRGEQLLLRFSVIPSAPVHRFQYWQDTIRIVKDFPLLGGGLGSCPTLFHVYTAELPIDPSVAHPHSDYLSMAAEMGLPGIALIGLILLLMAKRTIDLVRRTSSPARYLNLACLVGMAPILIQSAFDVNFEMPANVFLFLSLLALSQVPAGKAGDTQARRAPVWAGIAAAVSMVVAAALLMGYIWHEHAARALLRDERFMEDSRSLPEERIPLLRQAVQIEPRLAPAQGKLGKLIDEAARDLPDYSLAEAGACYVKAIRAEPLDPYYHFYLGCFYAEYGNDALGQQADRSEAELRKACRLSPTDDTFSFTLGRYCQRQKRLDEAVDRYRDALALRSFYLPHIIDALWDETRSLDLVRRAVPPRADLQFSVAELLIKKKENDAALAQVDHVMALGSATDWPLCSRIARCLMRLGAWEKAGTCLRECQQHDPGNMELRLDLVTVLSKQGKSAEAMERMEQIAKEHPDNAAYLASLGDLYLEAKHEGKAEDAFTRAKTLDPRYYPRLGGLYARQKQLHKVVSLYQEWVKRRPNEGVAHRYLGLALEQTGNLLGALGEYEKAAQLDPKGAFGGDIERAKKRLDKQIDSLKKAKPKP